jgi:hypothetical protein
MSFSPIVKVSKLCKSGICSSLVYIVAYLLKRVVK